MGTFPLTPSERKLCRKVAHGDRVQLDRDEVIRAKVIRHIVLGLPLFPRRGLKSAFETLFPRPADGRPCQKTAVGIRICGGIIRGRLRLDSAMGVDNGPICPLEFQDTWLDGGFSGANSHFGRLGFRECKFNDRPSGDACRAAEADNDDEDWDPADLVVAPTIELTGATVGGDLDMQGIRPVDDGDGRTLTAEQQPWLWIKAVGTRIGGNLNLSCAHLKAPVDHRELRDNFQPSIQPLDISLARIEGDFIFLGGATSVGPISARGARIAGDVWMSGATITSRAGDERALFFQLATIGGGLMLDGRREKADGKSGKFLPFTAQGTVNLFAVTVGGSLVLNDAQLTSADTPEDLCLNLTGARIGGRVDIKRTEKSERASLKGRIRFDRMEVNTVMWIKDVELGSHRPLAAHEQCIDARVLTARHLTIESVRPFHDKGSTAAGALAPLSINLQNARLQRLTIRATEFTGPLEASPLHCDGDVMLAGTFGDRVSLEGSTIGGSLDISELKIEGAGASLSLKDATIARALRLVPCETRSAERFEMNGIADLTALTCDTLDDDLGRRWGESVLIRMNHLTYQRTVWPVERPSGRGARRSRTSVYTDIREWIRARQGVRPWAWFARKGVDEDRPGRKSHRPSYRVVSDWIQSRRADGRLSWRFVHPKLLSDDPEFCDPWQYRRNWIYQQYTADPARDPNVSIARYRIRDAEYRPQPFEQAIKVARAEGREDFATRFEMHKQFLEWKLLNRRLRWGLGLVAIMLASLWLVIGRPGDFERDAATVLACLVTVGLMIFGSGIRDVLCAAIIVPLLVGRRWPIYSLLSLAAAILLAAAIPNAPVTRALAALAALPAIAGLIIGGCLLALRWARPATDTARSEWIRERSSKLLTWVVYGVPAIVLFLTGWWEKPFRFWIAFLIFLIVRLMAVLAHQLMRFGFGYLRQPIQAVATLIIAFLIGWWGVGLANSRDMLVVAAEPVAPLVGERDGGGKNDRKSADKGENGHGPMYLMGSEVVQSMQFADEPATRLPAPDESAVAKRGMREVSCAHEISEPLYALDVLIPIVDLGEETRCEVRRFEAKKYELVETEELNFGQLWRERGKWPLNDIRFWWWMKALYAIAGWVLVSLSLLTFAQVNRTHGEAVE